MSSCEACHGPGSNHVAGRASKAVRSIRCNQGSRAGIGRAPGRDLDTWRRNGQRAAQRAACVDARDRHVRAMSRRAARLSDDYVHGKSPLDTHRLALLDDDLYWNDGQMRDEVYNWGSFLQSKMYAQGVTCSDCHDPHSLKLKATGNAVCAQCHQPAKYDAPAHTHHAAGTPGAACATCHMPTTTYMVVDPRHDHSMRIPRPDLSVQLGTPNACTNCHAKKSPQWAADAIAHLDRQATLRTPTIRTGAARRFDRGTRCARRVGGADRRSRSTGNRTRERDRPTRTLLTPRSTDAVVHALKDNDASVRQAAVEALANVDPELRKRVLPRCSTMWCWRCASKRRIRSPASRSDR